MKEKFYVAQKVSAGIIYAHIGMYVECVEDRAQATVFDCPIKARDAIRNLRLSDSWGVYAEYRPGVKPEIKEIKNGPKQK